MSERLVQDRFLELACTRPELPAISSAQRTWTYSDLECASRHMAIRMARGGVRTGDVVVIDGDRSDELIVLLLAVVRAGAIFLVLGEHWPDGYKLAATAALPSLHWASTSCGRTGEAAVRRLVAERLKGYFVFAPAGSDDVPECPDTIDRNSGPMYLAATSGSTGRPKLVMGSHAPVVHFLDWYIERFDFGSAERFSLLSGVGYDPMLRDIFTPLSCGGSVRIPAADDLHTRFGVSRWLQREAVSVIHTTPSLAALIFDSAANISLPQLKVAALGGEPLSWKRASAIAHMAPRTRIVNFYGTTETPQAVLYHVVEAAHCRDAARADDQSAVPLGGPIADVEALLLDTRNCPCEAPDIGEICIRTRYHSHGYYGDAALTERSFVADPSGVSSETVYRTGDLGYRNGEAEVVFVGRKDRQVKCGGNRVQLEEVEASIRRITGAHHAVAILEGSEEHTKLACYVDTSQATCVSEEEIRKKALSLLPPYMIPRRFICVPRLPLTASGKLDVAALAASLVKPDIKPSEPVPHASGLHARLVAVWASVLQVAHEHLAIDSNFFEVGGNSLMAGRLVAAVNAEFQDSFGITDVFQYPKIRDWVNVLATRSRAKSPIDASAGRNDERGLRIAAARASRMRG